MLKNKTILVLGAAGLLGSQVVKMLAENGANIIAADLCLKTLKKNLKDIGIKISKKNILLSELDVTNEQEMRMFFDDDRLLAGAVNCSYPRNTKYGSHFFDVSQESFNENIGLQLGSTFLFNQLCAYQFVKYRRPLSVVNISSIYGSISPDFHIYEETEMTMPIEYAAVKSAIIHLVKYISTYIQDSEFRVNCVSPGGLLDNQPPVFLERYRKKTRGKGMLSPDDIIGAIVFLLSDNSQYITGQNLIVDDGFHL
ncbi:MAG: SDR family oxidoreductase [Cellvibrionaceae bacterium]